MTDTFGWQDWRKAVHWGVDFGRDGGSGGLPVFASQGGTVQYSGSASGFGAWVVVDHPTADGAGCTVYGHVIPEVKVGQRIEAGQRIARINPVKGPGNGGVDPHLHFEWHRYSYVDKRNERDVLNPLPLLAGSAYPGESSVPVVPPAAPTAPSGASKMKEINQIGRSPNHSQRWGSKPRLWVLHTQEGNGSAQSLANYLQQASSQVSYHYSIDNELCVDVVDTDRASWSVLDANSYSINLCFGGSRAAQSRDVWLDRFGAAIDYAAFLFVQDARKYGFANLRTLSWDEIRRGLAGGTDHYGITKGLGIGSHTDVGPNFPWDRFIAAIERNVKGVVVPPPAPAPNAIAVQYEASPWLGAKITQQLELTTPDGRGRYAQYENGYIYWTAETGARPVPKHLFETYSELGWETGVLGYPIAFHTVLPDGDVQAYEKGVLYRRNGQPGFVVTGLIGERWKRSGFETGPFGWPTSNEVVFDGGAYQDFEHGRIFWNPKQTVGLLNADGADTPVEDK
ncbi:hypothetical protein CH302_19250 [Rhodococcus sp. 15-2388-1-1a]|nr:hypothetical protein CH302_19250 [Rhodococcus sp. 15-2388-1-1a]